MILSNKEVEFTALYIFLSFIILLSVEGIKQPVDHPLLSPQCINIPLSEDILLLCTIIDI